MRIRRNNHRSLVALTALMSLMSQPLAMAEDMSWPSEDTPGQTKPKDTGTINSSTKAAPSEAGQSASEVRLQPESAVAAPGAIGAPTHKNTPAGAVHSNAPAQHKATAAKRAPEVTLTGKAETMKLFGRIDQIAGEANVEMPVLKMEKAQLDTVRRAPLRAAASESRFSGSVATSFPMDFSGTWGGTIKVWRYSVSPLSYEVDAAESKKLRDILSPGTAGDVNFVFQHESGNIDLEPAQVRIMIPASQSYSYQKMMQGGGQMQGMGGMVSQMMANMKVPVILHFGTVSTNGSMEVGVSGNQIDQRVVKNDIRQLAPTVVEEQIITKNNSVQSGNGKSESGYTESVLRFTRQSSSQLYVLAASVDYDSSGKFLRKLIMYGNVVRGQVMNTSPVPTGMGNLTQMMQGMEGGAGGAGGMSGLSSILNGMAGSGGQSSSGSNYANNPAVRQYLNNSTSGGGSNMEGFGQLMNSLNMLNH
ncbi:MAG: hypothetical protein SGJ27_04060 [Candidatus Melainabacteria bacterium]|nr:hypothetical protein [Candidatus Melainabacteria bacterium]